jgi:predicted regulator of Ras-like GTPase activity (Roadblock/LC7/MglB family)
MSFKINGMEYEEMVREIKNYINAVLKENGAIKAISVGTSVATNIATVRSQNGKIGSENELIAATTSLSTIANDLYRNVMKGKMEVVIVTVRDELLITILGSEITMASTLDRSLAELSGLDFYKRILLDLAARIEAFVETSEYITEDLFVAIKRAIPECGMLAVLTMAGSPIRIDVSGIEPVILASIMSAISNLVGVILKKPLDYAIIEGKDGNVVILQIDSDRILGIGIPNNTNQPIGKYIAKIKEIIRKFQ